ncbi:MAG TPA: alcohol dehydrogenase catalytic domain-containing protein [Gemmatimonadales bacterium]|nr:alcohol dehydrogenase catalytic domain-containing protein [Gemmatimonadales bacterium]
MRALILPSLGIESRPDPVVHDGEVLVRVHAAGINRADLAQRAGRYPAPSGWPADIPGLEYAGEVVAAGRGVTYWTVGDRVMGLVGGGAQAEYLVVRQDEAIAIPDRLSWAEAAAIPEAFLTALKTKAERNSRLLLASLAGVRAAAAQIDAIAAARGELRTYTAAGASVAVAPTPGTRDQRI